LFGNFGAAADYDDDDDKGRAGFELNDDRRAVGKGGVPRRGCLTTGATMRRRRRRTIRTTKV
jgi:hypothetical protein